MKKITTLLFAAVLICGCTQEKGPKCIGPLPAGYDLEALTDCMVPAEFSTEDFDWANKTLKLTVFSENIYDAVEMHKMAVGDTVIYDGKKILVQTIDDSGSFFEVNGEDYENGAWFQPADGGTYRATQDDDHSVYTELGSVIVPVAENLVVVDCGIDPMDPQIIIEEGAWLYLDSLDGWRQSFSCLDTEVLIENGVVTKITRHWIP